MKVGDGQKLFEYRVILPANVTCQQCILQVRQAIEILIIRKLNAETEVRGYLYLICSGTTTLETVGELTLTQVGAVLGVGLKRPSWDVQM